MFIAEGTRLGGYGQLPVYTSRGFAVTLARMLARHTKIVATLGPATDRPGVLDQLIEAGLDCARLNCSHGGPDDLRRRARDVREAAQRAGRPVALMFDLQGPKLRLSSETEQRVVEVGDTVTFAGSDVAPSPDHVAVDFPGFSDLVTDRSEIVIGDGVPRMVSERVENGAITTTVVSRGPLSPRKGITVTYARPTLPAITDKDLEDLDLAVEMEADFVALSFVRSGADMQALRDLLTEKGSDARTIAKVEKVEGYERLDEVIAASDGIMVARGDYGVEAGVARVPLMQKDTIVRSTQAGKLVITATHMLESMVSSAEPTRAEAADVANAVIDGTSAVMLSAETSVGAHPVEAVRAMGQIAEAAEEAPIIRGAAHTVEPSRTGRRRHARGDQPRRRRRRLRPDRPDGDRRHGPRVREVPPPAADHRARPRPARRQPARARVGGAADDDGRRGVGRRAHRRGARARARLRRPRARRPRGADGGAADRHARRDEPHHAARDPVAGRGGVR